MITLFALDLANPFDSVSQPTKLGGVSSLDLFARLELPAGGALPDPVVAWVQTAIGEWYFDLACFAFSGAATCAKHARLPGTSVRTPQVAMNGMLPDDAAVDGPFGERYRVKVKAPGGLKGANLSILALPTYRVG